MALRLNTVFDMAEGILACVCAALDEAKTQDPELPGCPCRAFVAPGSTVAWDCGMGCDDACQGQLTVNLAGLSESTSFPASSTSGSNGAPKLPPGCVVPTWTVAEYVVTILRCVPTMDESGAPPEPADLRNAAVVAMADAEAVYDALACCVKGLATGGRVLRYQVGRQRTLGPQGACAGTEARLTVYLPNCPCPEEGSIPLPLEAP